MNNIVSLSQCITQMSTLHTFIYNLKEVSGKSVLSIDLGGNIVSENLDTLVLNINGKLLSIDKSRYLNKMKVIDDGKTFFIICSKQISRNYAFQTLLEYAVKKIDSRISFITTLREQFVKELNSLKLKAA